MEVILDCFFENFGKLDRDTLHARYKRIEMVDYFNTMIEGCCRGEELPRSVFVVKIPENQQGRKAAPSRRSDRQFEEF